jgi:hypothetical protein
MRRAGRASEDVSVQIQVVSRREGEGVFPLTAERPGLSLEGRSRAALSSRTIPPRHGALQGSAPVYKPVDKPRRCEVAANCGTFPTPAISRHRWTSPAHPRTGSANVGHDRPSVDS